MARVYATGAQVQQLVGITGATEITLRRASRAIDGILKGAVYDVDVDGMPTDPEVLELFAEMVAEQVGWYRELGDETGAAVTMGGGSIGSVSLPTLARGTQTVEDVMQSPRAHELAHNSELLTWRVEY